LNCLYSFFIIFLAFRNLHFLGLSLKVLYQINIFCLADQIFYHLEDFFAVSFIFEVDSVRRRLLLYPF